MAKISNLKVGQTLYDIQRMNMGNTTIKIGRLYCVVITEISPENNYVIASWNMNTPRKYYQSQVNRWKVKEPKPKTKIWGQNSY